MNRGLYQRMPIAASDCHLLNRCATIRRLIRKCTDYYTRLAHQIPRPAINPKTPTAVAAFFRQLPQGTSERQPAPESRSFEKFPAAGFSSNRSDGRNKSPTGPQDSTIGCKMPCFEGLGSGWKARATLIATTPTGHGSARVRELERRQ
ncbi:MAG UNVERIFIED_CONTAM: hypothetical protein LVR18_24790 [Planctomycetaceae bacterium]|jgi:hypothetical protein